MGFQSLCLPIFSGVNQNNKLSVKNFKASSFKYKGWPKGSKTKVEDACMAKDIGKNPKVGTVRTR